MILYRPVTITSAEQAEEMPVGTIATNGTEAAIQRREANPFNEPGSFWWVTHDWSDPWFTSEYVLGWTALVPTEAEEERKGFRVFPRPKDAPWPPRHYPQPGRRRTVVLH